MLGKPGLLMGLVSKLIATYRPFFPFTIALVAVFYEDFHEWGAVLILNWNVCWCEHILLSHFVTAGFVTANCSVAPAKEGLKSHEQLGNYFRVIFFCLPVLKLINSLSTSVFPWVPFIRLVSLLETCFKETGTKWDHGPIHCDEQSSRQEREPKRWICLL